MPKSGGLQDVSQRVDLDASQYVKGADETVLAAIRMAEANDKARKSFDELGEMQFKIAAALAGTEGQLHRLIGVQKEFDTLGTSVQAYTERVRGLANGYEFLAAASERNAEQQRDIANIAVASIGIQKKAQEEYYETIARVAQASKNIQITALGEVAAEHVKLGQEIEATGRAFETSFTMKAPAMVRSMNTIQSKAESLNKTLETVRTQITEIATAKGDKNIAAVFGEPVSGAGTRRDASAGISAANLAAAAAANSVSGGPRRDSELSILAPALTSALRAHDESNRFSSVIPGLIAGGGIAALMSLLGSPGMVGAIASGARSVGGAVAGAAGGAGGFIRGTVGSGAGAFDMGRAATESATVGTFVARWYPVAHWAMMLGNELLATAGPAVVAAGMGALVGMQGGEQVVPRMQAIFDTSESLGDSLGITAGQAAGLKNSPLQTAQDLATGGAVELTGAGINAIRAGAGNSFIQLGTNTVAMFDRFAATMTQEFQHGLGDQLGNIVSGGSGYLQQFGDVLANLGDVFLHVAPNLPGVGGDLLSTLQGGLGGLAKLTGFLGTSLGPILAFEGGARYGPTLVGGAARGLSRVSGGLLGNVARTATAADAAAMAGVAEGDVIAGTGAAGALGSLGAVDIGAIAAAAFTANKAFTYKTHAQLNANSTLAAINQMGFAQATPSILTAMQAQAAVPAGDAGGSGAMNNIIQGQGKVFAGIGRLKPSELFQGAAQEWHGLFQSVGINSKDPSNFQVAQTALQSLSNTMVNSLGAGQQIATEWKGLTGSTLGMSKAFDVATMAQLQLGSSFEKNGKLTGQAKTMISNLQAGYQAMNFTGVHGSGMYGAAVGAQTAMAGLQHSEVGAVNQSYDQLMQLVTGGAAGSSGFFATLGGSPVTSRQGGTQLQAPPAFKAMAKALTSFTSASGAAAWNTMTNTQNGLIPQLGNQTDWLRSMQTMGALSPGQTTQMTAFQMQQLLPMMRKSPAGLAMLSTIGQEFGGPAMQGNNQEANFKRIADWTNKFAGNAKSYNQDMNAGTVAASKIPRDAQQFTQQIGSGIVGGLAQGITAHGADLQNKFMDSMIGNGGKNMNMGALRNYATFLANSGVPKTAGMDMTQQVAKLSGAGSNAAVQNSIKAMIAGVYASVKVNADISQAKSAIQSLTHLTSQPKVKVQAEVSAAQAAINAIRGKDIPVSVRAQGISAVEGAISAIHGKTVTITINTVNRIMTQLIGATTQPGGVASATLVGGPANMRLRAGAQTGMKIPGYGGGDIFPAMLEPGELVVPKHLVGSVAPILGGKIPGFQSGGGFGVMGFETMLQEAFHGEAVQDTMQQILDGIFGKEIQKFPRGMQFSPSITVNNSGPRVGDPRVSPSSPAGLSNPLVHPGSPLMKKAGTEFSVEILKGITEGIKNAKGAAKTAATAMMNHISQEIQYAKSTATNLTQGMNFGGMDTTQGPVQTQMKSYADSLKAFSGDIKSMTKGGLNKDLLKQMIAAGPVQGDALAQSIKQGPGGIKAVNQLYSQIQKMSKGIAGQGASAIYGGHLNSDLKSGTFVNNNVSIHISMGGSGGGDLGDLSTKQLNQLVAKIQAALLKQAKRNRKTGIALPKKGA